MTSTDDNGGSALVGDSLTGNYTYGDVDGDAEGTTTFRWLRGGVAIAGATASSYTLVTADPVSATLLPESASRLERGGGK